MAWGLTAAHSIQGQDYSLSHLYHGTGPYMYFPTMGDDSTFPLMPVQFHIAAAW